MTDQRNPNANYGRAGGWGMITVLLGIVAMLFVGYLVFGASPEAPNTTKSSEYQQNR